MKTKSFLAIINFLAASCCASLALAQQPAPATLRVDYMHTGDAKSESYAIERVVIEPLPWPGNLQKNIDHTNRGVNLFEVRDAVSNELLYSRGFSTIFGEWQSTEEASKQRRGFQESLRFPDFGKPVKVSVLKRESQDKFVEVWHTVVDAKAQDVVKKQVDARLKPVPIHVSGPSSEKVDLLVLGDGYTQQQMTKFVADAKRLAKHLFTVSPFKERAKDFNVWALAVPTPEAGVSRPSTGHYKASTLGTRYDIFASERYVLTLDNRALREISQYAPYEFIEILVNNETYGGGGIFGQFSTAAASNDWANYLFVHEFGHHFAGLADEYYTSPVAYATGGSERQEPWEPNVTALKNPAQVKWQQHVKAGTPMPTPWAKEEYEKGSRAYQAIRAELRKNNRPESEMSALFKKDLAQSSALFDKSEHRHTIGAFEGANYEATGFYRSEMQCIMFDRSEKFCQVCQDGISTVIDLYSAGAAKK